MQTLHMKEGTSSLGSGEMWKPFQQGTSKAKWEHTCTPGSSQAWHPDTGAGGPLTEGLRYAPRGLIFIPGIPLGAGSHPLQPDGEKRV